MNNKVSIGQKWSSWVLTILLTIALSACGQKDATNTSESNSSRANIIKNRGKLICGVNGQLPGFSFVNAQGEYSGMDVDLCRAIAAALFDDPKKVEFRNLSAQERFTALATGEVDVLNRNTTWTISRDLGSRMEFAPTTFYDGQGLMVTKASQVKTLDNLNAKTICVQSGTTTEINLADRMRQKGINYTPVVIEDDDVLFSSYAQGRCEAVTADRSQLVARRINFPNPETHLVLDVVLSKEPLGPVVASGDSAWFDTVKWIVYALFEAEELGITTQNLSNFQNSKDPNVRRFLGIEGSLGEDMGLANDFALRILKHVGNYGEIYERNVGKPFNLDRGLNQIWTKGGLLYSPPFR
jgi:general L-amino acid transport system substrate-binding protein